MKRFALGLLVAIACTGAVPAAAQASAAKLKRSVCQRSAVPAQRAMSITAVMRPIPGTARMAMKFQLLRSAKRHGRTTSVAGGGLKSWLMPSDPTLGSRPGDTWVVKHPVVELAAPAYYRFKVTFHWLNSSGHVIGHADRRGPICFQPEPDLDVLGAWSSGTHPGQYRARVLNRGPITSGQFNIQVTEPNMGLASSLNPLPPLRPHQQETVMLQGAPCTPGEMLKITVIPVAPASDYDMADNTATVKCPFPVASSAAHRRR